MTIWFLQIKGLGATGLLAAIGISVMVGGFYYQEKWRDRVGWIIIGGIFVLPFIAVLILVVVSRWG